MNEADARPDDPYSIIRSRRGPLVGAALAAVGLTLFVVLVGSDDVFAVLGRVSTKQAVVLLLAGFCPVLVWGVSLRIVLATVGIRTTLQKAVGLFVASVFLNSITPFGQVGGDPPSGLLIASESDARFESGIAAIASVNALNRIAVVLLGAAGGVLYTVHIATSETLRNVIILTVALTAVSVTVAVVAWLRRDTLVDMVGCAFAALLRQFGAFVPVVNPPTRDSVVSRVGRFVAAIERVGSYPLLLATAFLLGIVGQIIVASVLWLALTMLGATISPWVVLLVLPAAKLAGLVPLPGGSVGAETLLSGLLVTGTDITLPVATAAVLLYRAVTFWVPTVAGGLVTVALLVRTTDA